MNPRFSFVRRPAVWVWVGMLTYSAFFSWFTIARAHNFNAGWYDLGIMSQTVWNVGHGHGFTFTNPEAGPGGVHGVNMARSSIHADYLLILLAPLSWFGHTAEALLIVQSVVLALGAWFIFRITQRITQHDWLGVFLAWVYLLYPPLQNANIFDFHAVTLSATFFLAAADAILASRHRWFWVWVGLALITKEQVGITLGLLGGVLYWWKGERRRAMWALAIPWTWTVLQVLVAIPLSRPGQSAHFVYDKFYDTDGESPRAIFKTVFDPHRAWQLLMTRVHEHAAWQLLIPLGGIWPLLGPVMFLALPEVLLYWLWDTPNPQTLLFHYHALFIPFIFLGLIFGWRNLQTIIGRWWPRGKMVVNSLWVFSIFFGTLFAVWQFGPWSGSRQTRWPVVAWKERLAPSVQQAMALIPPTAGSVAITQNLGGLVNQHPTIEIVPNGLSSADYVILLQRKFDANTHTDERRQNEKTMLEQLIPYLQHSQGYAALYHDDRVWLFHRIGDVTEAEPTWPENLLGR